MKKTFLTLAVVCSLMLTSSVNAQWRSENRDGIYPESNLLSEWPDEGPELLWHFDQLGRGHGSPIVANNTVFVAGEHDGRGYLYAFDLQGNKLWETDYGKEWDDSYPGARATPVFHDKRLYLATAYGEAICLYATSGKIQWKVDMQTVFGADVIRWGMVETPIVYDNKVIFTPGGSKATMVALNTNTGSTVWQSESIGKRSAYCSPLLVEHNNKKILITALEDVLIGVDANSGEMLWQHPQVNRHGIHPNTPIYSDGYVFSTTGYGTGSIMLQLSADGESVEQVWSNEDLDNQMGGAVLMNGMLIASGHQNNRNWQALDFKTGTLRFESDAIGKGVVIAADEKLYLYSDRGELALMELSAEGFALQSSARVTLGSDQHWAHPIIVDGILYLRHGNTIMAYSIQP